MALQTKIGLELPKGAVALSSEEALKYQWTFIKNWPSEAEVLSIKFGRHIASASTFFSSVYILSFFKRTLNINRMRFLISTLPGVAVPTVLSYNLTDSQITNSVLLMKLRCPLCDQLKFGVFQFYTGLIFPGLYSYFTMAGFAAVTNCAPMPNFNTHPREFWKFTYQTLKNGLPYYRVVALAQTFLILFLPYFQNKQLMNVMSKVNENSESLDDAFELQQ